VFGILDKYIAVFFSALVVTYLLTPLVRALACRFGIVDVPGERRMHKHPTARGGGLAVVLGVQVACLVGLTFPQGARSGGFNPHWWLSFAPCSLILLAVGLWDDIRGMRPWQKLCGQTLAATLICLSGTGFGEVFGIKFSPLLDTVLAVIWIVAVINAFNLIDGLDGLASGLAIISATGLCGILVLGNLPGVVLVLVALIGACLAFLRYNFHPATIFLGDTGSMFIGFVLGVVSLQTFTKNTFLVSMTIPMLVVGVPLYDALLAIWRRSVRRLVNGRAANGENGRKGIMTADLDHVHHRLSRAGLSTSRVAILLFLTNAALVICGLLLTTFNSHASGIFLLALLGAAYVLLRHMAVIELRETGRALLAGLHRPTHALAKSLAYPFWDMFWLAGSLAAAMWLFEPAKVDFWHSWFLDLPIWVTPTFSLLALSRTYVTVWTRARVLDVLMLIFTLLTGLLVSLGLALLIDPLSTSTCLLRALMGGAIAHSAIVGARVFYRCMEEIVLYLKSSTEQSGNPERIVLYGAGARCQVFLTDRGFARPGSSDGRTIVGLIDDEPSLQLKWVYGHLVLGGLRDLTGLIARHRITGIVITADLAPQSYEAVQKMAVEAGLTLREWRPVDRQLNVPAREVIVPANPGANAEPVKKLVSAT
jgi:UDP-GlcNAc:undecaprenyl-phosphate/decaprenyl-phosphate GlcNAc-1-phosphate transferase